MDSEEQTKQDVYCEVICMGRKGSSGMSGGDRLPTVRVNENWLYQPEPFTPDSDIKKNPIPFVGIGNDADLDAKLNYNYSTRVTNTRRDVEVNVDDLKTLQPFVTQSGVDRQLRGEGSRNSVKVVQYKGQMYVTDGNHRAAIAKMRGDKTIRVTLETRVDK